MERTAPATQRTDGEPGPPGRSRSKPSVSMFIPAFNESAAIERSIRGVEEVLRASFEDYRIIVVDDGSTDGTADIVGRCLTEHVELQRFVPGRTWRENLALAMSRAETDLVGFVDADLSPDVEAIPVLAEAIHDGADVAVGSRRRQGARCERRLYRKAVSRAWSDLNRLLFGDIVQDFQCGLKLFRRNVFQRLFHESRYEGRLLRGWFWDVEVLVRAHRLGFRIAEVPLHWNESSRASYVLLGQVRLLAYTGFFFLKTLSSREASHGHHGTTGRT